MVTMRHVSEGARAAGMSGRPICVHASLRSFGWVEGGASAVVDGLLAEGCTVMVPTFSWTFAVPPPRAEPPRNGWDYEGLEGPTGGIGRAYSPDTMEMDEQDMGAIPAAVVGRAGRVRGNHPLCSFAAVGPRGHELISGQEPLNVWAPLGALAEEEGAVVLMGVGLDKMTLLHLAEQVAGRNPFRRWANGPDGQTMEVEVGGCSDGLGSLDSILSPVMRESKVGGSVWRVFPAEAALDAAARAIRRDPMITHCGDPGCGRCRDAVAGGPRLEKW
jgi:aminoglycoside N3'-acetyltransferase